VRITLRCFAALRELRGRAEEPLELPEGVTVGEALAHIGLPHGYVVATAVGAEIVGPSHVLRPGDELALLPPLGGG
jgi:molybdopterin converting factor small subunit